MRLSEEVVQSIDAKKMEEWDGYNLYICNQEKKRAYSHGMKVQRFSLLFERMQRRKFHKFTLLEECE